MIAAVDEAIKGSGTPKRRVTLRRPDLVRLSWSNMLPQQVIRLWVPYSLPIMAKDVGVGAAGFPTVEIRQHPETG